MICNICINLLTNENIQCKNCKQKICENCLTNVNKNLKKEDDVIYLQFNCFYCRNIININITDNIEKYKSLVIGIMNKLIITNTELLNNCKNYKELSKKEDDLIEDAYYNDLITTPS